MTIGEVIFLTAALFLLQEYDPCLCSKELLQDASSRLVQDGEDGMVVTLTDDGAYELSINGQAWLRSAPTFFNVDSKMHRTDDGTLLLRSKRTDQGEDALGPWTSVVFQWTAGKTTVVETSIRKYKRVPAVVFGQEFPDGANRTSVGDTNKVLSGFPSFLLDGTMADLGYMSYGGLMVGWMHMHLGRWGKDVFSIRDGTDGGPMALFDRNGSAIFISPFNNFMAASVSHDKDAGTYTWGIMGGVKDVPRGFSSHTVLFYSREGINKAISNWGDAMRLYYNKHTYYRDADLTNTHLSYWSDNGAYYVNYYVAGGLIQNMTYERAMLEVNRYRHAHSIPYRSIQYSVWFRQGKYGGISEWVASPELFPDGMRYMFEKTNLPATAHNRWWDPDTVYAKQNGGDYDFVVERLKSLPVEERFWRDFFRWSRQMGFANFMQDWLNAQFDDMNVTTQSVDVGRTWLMQMGEGARLNGVTIQYCMSLSRHVLQSLEIPVVTQARASDDYGPRLRPDQWRIGKSSMFAYAVGLAPFKDTFWTTTVQPGNYYNGTEPYPALEAAVATLSTGPVGPGDMVNGTDVDLLMRCCAADGLILKPSKPAMAIDAQIMQEAFFGGVVGTGQLGPDGEVWTTYSDIHQYRFGIIFAADMSNTFAVGPTAAGFGREFPRSKVYQFEDRTPQAFDDQHPVSIGPKCSKTTFCMYYTAPVMEFRGEEVVLMGEASKWVPMSPQRVKSIRKDRDDLTVQLHGAAREKVNFAFSVGGSPGEYVCELSEAGTATVSFYRQQCLSV